MKIKVLIFLGLVLTLAMSCGKDPEPTNPTDTLYTLVVPKHFPQPSIPADNPLTVNKIKLGRMLFYDKRISEDQKVACANCHKQEFAFGSDKPLDVKVHGAMTTRNTSVLFNLAFTKSFFWDGRTSTLEATCLDALKGEQKFDIAFVKNRLLVEQQYQDVFKLAFNTTTEPTEDMVTKALASFIRTMVSGNSKVDKGKIEGNPNKYLSQIEMDGRTLFETETGDCFHCHGDISGQPLMTDNLFHNNALDANFTDLGLGSFTKNATDNGKFKTPALRNLSYSAPYMHDGRFATLRMVLGHYNQGLRNSSTVDPNMKKVNQGGLQVTPDKLDRLEAYLRAFDDSSFIADTAFRSPF